MLGSFHPRCHLDDIKMVARDSIVTLNTFNTSRCSVRMDSTGRIRVRPNDALGRNAATTPPDATRVHEFGDDALE
jgi:hypothetical protein